MKRSTIGYVTFFMTLAVGLATSTWLHFANPNSAEQKEVPTIELQEIAATAPVSNSVDSADLDDKDRAESVEVFINGSRIGRARANKVEVRCVSSEEGTHTEINFFSRNEGRKWVKKQSFEFDKRDRLPCDPAVKDFNNDGYKDLTYQSGEAARGANDVRKLFIYDRKKDSLVYITNSDRYPNLAYNKTLHCLDAWMFHATTTTVFLKLEGDALKEFASVDTGLERVACVIDSDGTRRVISRKKMKLDDIYTRYSTFDPPRP
ncbi:MAG TPA: hypothetical protein VK468_03290 [Pyrinomonadaceae bacterium]|nr:hypothetical protein [Pyrinomonadaceae bacterium]